jgi:hypothetical protein
MDRRNFLKNSSALSALPFLGQDGDYTRSRNKKPSFRVVFMSDIHVKDDDVSKAGMKKALTHIIQLKKKTFIYHKRWGQHHGCACSK